MPYTQRYKAPRYAPAYATRAPARRFAPRVSRPPKRMSTADQAWSLAKKGANQLKKLKRVLNTEEKIYDLTTNFSVVTAATVVSLLAPAQGDAFNQRDGDSVRPLNLEFKWILDNNILNTTLPFQARILIFRATGERGSIPVISDILESVTAGANIVSPHRYSTRERYNVLYDHTEHVTPGGWDNATSDGAFTTRLSGHTLYTPGATTVEDGGLYLVVVSDTTSDAPAFRYGARTWFSDT